MQLDPRTKKCLLAGAALFTVTLLCPPWVSDPPLPGTHWAWLWSPPPSPAQIAWTSLRYEWLMLAAVLLAIRLSAIVYRPKPLCPYGRS